MSILTIAILLVALVLSAVTTAWAAQRNHDVASAAWLIGGILFVEWGLMTLALILVRSAEQWTTPIAATLIIAGTISLAAGTAAGVAYAKRLRRRTAGH